METYIVLFSESDLDQNQKNYLDSIMMELHSATKLNFYGTSPKRCYAIKMNSNIEDSVQSEIKLALIASYNSPFEVNEQIEISLVKVTDLLNINN